MTDPISVLLSARAIERILIILTGATCIVLGWTLFRKDLAHDGEADIRHDKLQIKLRRIAPGVFFALFGAGILTVSLMNPVTLEVTGNPTLTRALEDSAASRRASGRASPASEEPTAVPSFRLSGAGVSVTNDEPLHTVRALNTVLNTASSNTVDQNVRAASLSDLKSAVPQITLLRDRIVAERFGTINLDLWKKKATAFHSNPQSVSEEERATLEKLSPWMEETISYE